MRYIGGRSGGGCAHRRSACPESAAARSARRPGCEAQPNRYGDNLSVLARRDRSRGHPDELVARHITVTNYCLVLDRFIEKNPGYVPLIDSGNPGNWPKSGRNARVPPVCNSGCAANPTCQVNQRKDAA